MGELRTLRKYYPDLWQKMLDLDSLPVANRDGFTFHTDGKTLHDLDARFAREEEIEAMQISLF